MCRIESITEQRNSCASRVRGNSHEVHSDTKMVILYMRRISNLPCAEFTSPFELSLEHCRVMSFPSCIEVVQFPRIDLERVFLSRAYTETQSAKLFCLGFAIYLPLRRKFPELTSSSSFHPCACRSWEPQSGRQSKAELDPPSRDRVLKRLHFPSS